MSEKSWGTFTVAFIAGVGIGTAMGMIFAPKSGEELRGDLSDAARDAINQAGSVGARATRRARRLADDVAAQVGDAVEAGRREYDRAKSHIT